MALIPIYPDNPKRLDRAKELSSDCNIGMLNLASSCVDLVSSVQDYDLSLRSMLLSLGVEEDDSRLNYQDITFDDKMLKGLTIKLSSYIFEAISAVFTERYVSLGIKTAIAKRTLFIPFKEGVDVPPGLMFDDGISGRSIISMNKKTLTVSEAYPNLEAEAEDVLMELAVKDLKFPGWFKFKVMPGAGGIAAGIAVAVVLEVAIEEALDAYEGHGEKEKLEKFIRGVTGPRLRIGLATALNRSLSDEIKKHIGNLSIMRDLGYSQEQVDKIAKTHAKKIKDLVSADSYKSTKCDTVHEHFVKLDQSRKSYTDSDALDSGKCKDKCCWGH